MKRLFSIALVIFLFGNLAILPQAKRKSVSQLPNDEPFKIAEGSTFSASRSGGGISSGASQSTIAQDFSEALDVVRKNYVGGNRIDYSELTKSSISAMLRTLDPHSNYFDAAEYRELLTDQNSEYFGIGATIANYLKDGKYETFIISTFPDSPASKAHLRFGDKILAVNGENVSGKNSSVVRDKIRGSRGTVARLTIERAETRNRETIEIRRNRVPQPSIPDAYLLRENIGYVDLSEGFNYTTFEELDAALKDLRDQGMQSLILDLRGNPGGILEQAVKVAEKFLPAGTTIVSQRGRFRIDNRTWKSANKSAETMPLVVLVDEGSASASEIVAGALQDYDRAFIVGENTFGKGLVQSVINLPYGSGLTLTTAKYYTPSGRSIQRDYSNGNLYDYYLHKIKIADAAKIPSKTITGRTVYGGDGITPDEPVKTAELNPAEISLLDPLFFFTADLTSGRIRGFEGYRIQNEFQYGQRIGSGAFPVSDDLLEAFRKFVSDEKGWNVSVEQIEAERSFIRARIRYNLATASFGGVAANQILIEDDPQVAKAVEALPRAKQLALAAQKSLQTRK